MNIVERMIAVREEKSGKTLSVASRERYMREGFKVLEAALYFGVRDQQANC